MPRYPFFGFPYFNQYNRQLNYRVPRNWESTKNSSNQAINNFKKEENSITDVKNTSSNTISSSTSNAFTKINSNKNNNRSFIPKFTFNNVLLNSSINAEEPVFEILGIKLYLDDVIILCLLFILYQEDVKDEMLFIILILLLLS